MTSRYADEGTIAHALAAMALTEGRPASAYINRVIESEDYEHAALSPSTAHRWMRCTGSHALETRIAFVPRKFSMVVTHEMAEAVQVYLDNLAKYTTGRGATFLVEQRLGIEHLTGEKGATGSGDCVVFDDAAFELQVHDLKFGKGVEVAAEGNEQLAMYLLAAMKDFADFAPPGGWQRFRGVIHQPRIRQTPDEYVWSREELERFATAVRGAAHTAIGVKEMGNATLYLVPGEKQCKFCDAKATCPAVQKLATETVLAEFVDLDAPGTALVPAKPETIAIPADNERLAKLLQLVPIIDSWCEHVVAHAEAELLAGRAVPGYKLVQGRKGNRKWRDETEVTAALQSMRLRKDEMYEMSLISPATAEKLFKDEPKRWARLEGLITQSDGKPTVVPETDKRPALEVKPIADEFTNLEEIV